MIQVTQVLIRCDSCEQTESVMFISANKEGITQSGMFLCPSCFATVITKFKGELCKP
jgi:hypothetical protein